MSSTSLSGGDDTRLADSSSSSYPEPSFSISDSDSGSELSCSKYWLFLGVVFVDVVGEDLRRLDWREVGVDLAGERARFRGVELEDALGKWDFRWGIVADLLGMLRLQRV